jgi:alpha-mannosidase
MRFHPIYIAIIISLSFTLSLNGQTAWFADGYHGGIYGHYPMWQARFMVEQLKQNPGWAINLEIEPETWDTVYIKDSENFKAFQEYFEKEGKNGRIEFVNPSWAQPYCYNISGESIIRQFYYGIEKTREYFPGATFTTYSVEEPCFTSSLPQILKGFGFKYAVLRNPNTCWGGYTSGFNKDLVNWIGPDGTSMVSVPRYEHEALSGESTWQTESWTNSNEFIEKSFLNGVKYPVGMCFQDAGWDGGPWHNEYQPTVYTTWTSYISEIEENVEPTDWKFSLEDVKPGLVWGAQVLQKIAQEVRVGENNIIRAEKMAALDYLFHEKSWPEEDFREAWRTLMLAQHHDCWIVPYNGKPGNTWADKVTRWTNTTNKISNEKISGLFDNKNSKQAKIIHVYNTHGHPVNQQAELALTDDFDFENLTVLNSEQEIVPSQVYKDEYGKPFLRFEASVPGMGYSAYQLKKGIQKIFHPSVKTESTGKLVVETDYYTAIIDPSRGGTITSLIDKKNGNRQLVEKGKLLNNLKGFFYEEGKFYQGADNRAEVLVAEDGPMFTRIMIGYSIEKNKCRQMITFNKNNPRIDFELNIDWNGQPGIGAFDQNHNYKATDRTKAFYNDRYKMHLEFPLNNMEGKLYKNAPFDVCESKLDNTLYSTWDNIKHNVIVNWIDVTSPENDYGVALFTDHTTSYIQTEDLPLGLTVQYVGKALWGRDYKIHGPTRIKYALYPHQGNWETGRIQKVSNEWNEPLTAQLTSRKNAPKEKSLLTVEDENLEVSSMKIDGGSLIVRFFYTSSSNNNHKINWNIKADKVEFTDLNGTPVSDVSTEITPDGQLVTEIGIPQFGLRTLKLSGVRFNN